MTFPKTSPKLSSLVWIGTAPHQHCAIAAQAEHFEDSDDFLLSAEAYDYGFYVVHMEQRGVPAVDLIRLVRRRSGAGLVAVGAVAHARFAAALEAGADAVADMDAPAEYLQAVVAAVRRRVASVAVNTATRSEWELLESQSTLHAPDGTAIALSHSDLTIMRSFALAGGTTVRRSHLTQTLWGETKESMDGALHAALYRLRKRIEHAGQPLWPIYAVAGVGYEFRAPLRLL